MPVSIIEQFQLGTNLPLDARYIVSDPYDVSLYWYDGMLLYNPSTNQLFVVKDSSTEKIIEILDSSSAQILNIDGSISDLYVDLATQDSSIKWLFDNTYTKIYIDGSLNLKVNQSLFDSSILSLSLKDLSQDTSIIILRAKDASQDVSINGLWSKFVSNDASISALRAKDASQDASINSIWVKFGSVDSSIVSIRNVNTSQDASIVSIRNINTSQDASIILLRAKDASQDVSINAIWTKLGSVDTSLLNLGIKDSNQDVSINNLRIYVDGSLNNRVRITGDTMTGNLTTPGLVVTYDVSINMNLRVTGDVSIGGGLRVMKDSSIFGTLNLGKKLHFNPSDNLATASGGDLWVEPSTYNLMYKHPILTTDASSYDLTNRLLRTANDYVNFPDTSTFDDNDYILIEDASSGFAKRKITGKAFATAVTGGFGQNASYSQSLTESTTTSKTYQNKLTMDVSAAANTKYRIGWALWITNSNNSKYTSYRVQLDGASIDENTVGFPTGDSYLAFSGFHYPDVSAGNHTITVDYAAVTNTAKIKQVRLEWYRASDTA